MHSITHKIDWLFDEDLPSSEWSGSFKRIPFPYSPELAVGYAEHMEFHDGISLIKNFHNFINEDRPGEIPLGKFFVETSSSVFASHMMHQGCVDLIDNQKNLSIRRTPGNDIFSRLEAIDINQTLITDEDISFSIIFIPEVQLINLLGANETEVFFHNLGIPHISNYGEIKVPQTISNKIANCTPAHLTGNIRQLFANSVILQYLIELNIFISSDLNFTKISSNAKFDVDGLHAELLQMTGEIPKLNDIAKKFNVSAAKLNQVFFEKYNQSIFTFLSNQRLDQAYQGLLKTDIPMKILAHKIGYSHVNHFITAFKNKFGVTPGSLRRQAK